MPEVISNTSPLQYLHQAKLLYLLPQLAGKIIVPTAVADELRLGRLAGLNLPIPENLSWIKILSPKAIIQPPQIADLGRGETEVLMLCNETPDHLAILDDKQARVTAYQMGLHFTGTLGLILSAKKTGLIQRVYPVLETLDDLGFRITPHTRTIVLKKAGEI